MATNQSKLSSLIKSPLRSEQPIGTLVGLAIILVVIYLIYIGFTSKDRNLSHGWTLRTSVDNVANLPSGALVIINGVQVGNVNSIKLNPNNFNVDIKMTISGSIKIPTDSKLEIITNSLMSDKFIKITPGVATTYFQNDEAITGKS